MRGGTDDSFGIEVAKLAGVPGSVIKRAKSVLNGVEKGDSALAEGKKIAEKAEESAQFDFMSMESNAVTDALRAIDITTLTPIEALNKLYELQKML